MSEWLNKFNDETKWIHHHLILEAVMLLCSYAGTWTDKYKDGNQRRRGSTTNQLPSNKDYLADFLVWRPPIGWEKSRSFWLTLALWTSLVGAALYLQRWSCQHLPLPPISHNFSMSSSSSLKKYVKWVFYRNYFAFVHIHIIIYLESFV